MGQGTAAIREEIAQTRERMGETIDAIGYKADVPARTKESITGSVNSVKEKITGAGQDVRDRVYGSGQDMKDRVAGTGHQLADATPDAEDVRQAGRRAVGMAQANPFGLAIGAAAVGFLAGLALPSTPVEDERIGPMADQVRSQAAQVTHDATEHARQLAAETAEVARSRAAEVTEQVKGQAADAAGEIQGRAQDHAESLTDETREHAGNVTH